MASKGIQMLDALMTMRGEWATHCAYCARTVVNLRLMPAEYAPRHLGGLDKCEFFINGTRHIALVATADHYFERHRGGRSVLNNILPACRPCNNARSYGREIPLCIDCRLNRRTHGKRCEGCRRTNDLRTLDNDAQQRALSSLIKSVRSALTDPAGGGMLTLDD